MHFKPSRKLGFETEILVAPALSSIYGNHLVLIDKEFNLAPAIIVTNNSPETGESLKKLGNHLKKVTLLVDYPQEAFLPDEQLQFLTRIIGACKLNLGDVAILNRGRQALTFERIKTELAPEKILLIGVDPLSIGLPIQFPDFKPQFFNGSTFIKSPAAESMNQETSEAKVLKTQFWNGLKQLFQL